MIYGNITGTGHKRDVCYLLQYKLSQYWTHENTNVKEWHIYKVSFSIYIGGDVHTHPSVILRHTVPFMFITTPPKVSFQNYKDTQYEVNERKGFLKTVVKIVQCGPKLGVINKF